VYAEKVAETCPNRDAHTPSPHGYLEWHAWAEEMDKTHVQQECPGCGLMAIWVPREASAAEGPVPT
jgi:hypothetical protein